MKKRITILLLVLTVIFSMVLSGCTPAEEAPAEDPATAEEPAETGDTTEEPAAESGETEEPEVVTSGKGELIVGQNTEPSGDFATPYWQNNATDNMVNSLLGGYSTYELNRDAQVVLNDTAVENVEISDAANGGRTYQYTIKDGLTFSDGSPITAKDYVANVLFFSSVQITELGAKATYGQYFDGYEAFSTGESLTFSGVRLIDDKTFSVTLAADYVPWFFETAYVSVGPFKMSFWLDSEDVTVKDDGEGARFALVDEDADAEFMAKAEVIEEEESEEAEEDAEEKAPQFVQIWKSDEYKDAIDKARMEVNRPTSGPYKPKSFDKASKTVVIEINPEFKGNYEGQKPSIPTLIFKYTDDTTAMDQFKTGAVDVLRGVSTGIDINAGIDAVSADPDRFDYVDYPRSGYGKLQFISDLYPTKDVEVRQAIAHLIDRNEFARAFTGGFGGVVDGPYGEGQWYYMKTKAELDGVLNSYPNSAEEAAKLLDQAGWNLNADGGEYVEGEGLRHKTNPETGELMPLVIKWFSTENNPVSEQLVISLVENPDVAAVGMKVEQDSGDFPTLMNYLYRDGSDDEKFAVPTYHVFNLGSGLPATYLPTLEYTNDPALVARGYNTNFILDDELYEKSSNLGKVDPEDEEEFLKRYVEYITVWNKLLPDLPLYSNQLHDFFNAKLTNYETDDLIGLQISLLYATLNE